MASGMKDKRQSNVWLLWLNVRKKNGLLLHILFLPCHPPVPSHHSYGCTSEGFKQKPWIVAAAAAMRVTSVENADGDW